MRVIVSAGGTGGHIYPALAIISAIKKHEPNSEFLYIGTHNRMEKDIIPEHNIPFKPIEIYGLDRKNIFNNFKTIKCLHRAIKECKKTIKEFKPDIVIGFGGYVTMPVIYAAKKLGVKTFIHEQNSVAGASNLFLSKHVDLVGVSFKSSIAEFPKNKAIFTGNPCSEEASNVSSIDKKQLSLTPHKKLVLFVMGSLGSTKINDFLIKQMSLFNNKEYEVLFITGKNDFERINKNKFPKNVILVPYIEQLTRVLKQTDILVSRAGASTLSEIIALEVPSILIPSPYVSNNHQYKNALDIVNNNAAVLIEEKDLTGDILVRKIDELMNNQNKLTEMRTNLRKMQVSKSATLIYTNLKKLVDGK